MRSRIIDGIIILFFLFSKYKGMRGFPFFELIIMVCSYISYSLLYPSSRFSVLPPLFLASIVPSSSFPVFPFPSLYREGYFLPLPFLLVVPFLFVRGRFYHWLPLLLYPLLFFLQIEYLPFIFLIPIAFFAVRCMEEEIVYGEEFFGKYTKFLAVLFVLGGFFLIFFKCLKTDLLYTFLSLLFVLTGFLLKSATILLRHKLYFVLYSFVIVVFLLPAFG